MSYYVLYIVTGLAGVAVLYVLGQKLFTGYFFLKGKKLSQTTYSGSYELGGKDKPGFRLYVGGDSVAAGVGVTTLENTTAYLVADHFSKEHHVSLTNPGVVGYKIGDLLTESIPESQDVAVLIIASNDLLAFTDFALFEEQAKEVIKRFSDAAKQVIILGPLRVDTSSIVPFFIRGKYYRAGVAYARILRGLAEQYANVCHINMFEVVYQGQYGNLEGADRFHPNDNAHRFYTDLILSRIALAYTKKV